MVRLNLLLHRAFTIAFHTCSNKPAYLFREDWCRNLHASLLLESNGCVSVRYCRTKINLALTSEPESTVPLWPSQKNTLETYLGPAGFNLENIKFIVSKIGNMIKLFSNTDSENHKKKKKKCSYSQCLGLTVIFH